jgi:predicted Zn-dependent peptidase
MVFKGTSNYPQARYISEAVEGVGGIIDASTSPELTAYWAKVPVRHFPQALHVLGEMLLQPKLAPTEIEKERRIITEELHMITDAPFDWVFQLIGATLWPDHPLGRDVAGTEEGVMAIRREDLESYREQHYIAKTIVAVVAGAPSVAEAESAITAALGHLPQRPTQPVEAPPEPHPEPRIEIRYRQTEQVNLCLALPALSYNHPDRFALLLLNTILGAGMSSRLFLSIREEYGLAYNVFSGLRQYADTGAIIVYAGVDPGQFEHSLTAIWHELQRIAQEPVSEEELKRAKEYNKGRILLRMEDSYGVAGWYGVQEVLQEEIEEVDQVIARIDAVTPEDLHQLAATLFRKEMLRLASVGPFQEEDPVRRALGL